MSFDKYIYTVSVSTGDTARVQSADFSIKFLQYLNGLVKDSPKVLYSNSAKNEINKMLIERYAVSSFSTSTPSVIRLYATGLGYTADYFVGKKIKIVSGQGIGLERVITAYNTSTRDATVDTPYPTGAGLYPISGTSEYMIVPDFLDPAAQGVPGVELLSQMAWGSTYSRLCPIWLTISTAANLKVHFIADIGTSDNRGYVRFVIEGAAEAVWVTQVLCAFDSAVSTNYLNNEELISFAMGEKANTYFYFRRFVNSLATYPYGSTSPDYWGSFGTVKIDQPENTLDTDLFFYFYQNSTTYNYLSPYYNKRFTGEMINNTIQVATERITTYVSDFAINYYTKKIPIFRTWFGTDSYGIRGYTSHLIQLPSSYIITDEFYSIDGALYFGIPYLGSVNKQLLLKV